jgi:hypothetical protein
MAEGQEDFGSRRATWDDVQKMYARVGEITAKYGYTVGITGSTISYEDGRDIDILVLASVDAKVPASKVAQALLKLAHKLLYFEALHDDGSQYAMLFLNRSNCLCDFYILGSPEG